MKKHMFIQKVFGIFFILISVLMIYLAKTSLVAGDNDVTAVLFTLPLGLWLIFTKQYVLVL